MITKNYDCNRIKFSVRNANYAKCTFRKLVNAFFMSNIRFAHQLEYILTYILIEKLEPK